VADLTLTAAPVLGGYEKSFGDTVLTERTGLALVSLAIPLDGAEAAGAAIAAAFGLDLPEPGRFTRSDSHILVFLGPDQAMLAFDHPTPDAEPVVRGALAGAVYTTDQTDSWVALSLRGPQARAALERFCPIDVDPVAFPVGNAARTAMEHMGAVLLRESEDGFLLLSASSSAGSFLEAVETSLGYVT